MLTFIGSEVGDNWESWKDSLHYVDYAVLAMIVVGLAYLLLGRRGGNEGQRRPLSRPPMRRADGTSRSALLQGPAELLPVSSSGHVAALPSCSAGSTRSSRARAARRSRWRCTPARRWRCWSGCGRSWRRCHADVALLSMLPPVAIAFLAEERIEERLGSARSLAGGLVAGSVALLLADRRRGERVEADAGPRDGLLLGLAQACALVPGVSRSGATLSAARARGFARPDAVRLSRQVGAAGARGGRRAQGRCGSRAAAPGPARAARCSARARSIAAAATFAALPLARVLERDRPLAPWAAYRCALAGVRCVRDNRVR